LIMIDDFLIRAFLAGSALAAAAGPLGCFVVWRRMAYFGDATSHAALLGIALSLAFSVSPFIGVLIVAMAMAYVIAKLSGRTYALDTLLGVTAHVSLALGLVAVSKLAGVRLDLSSYLFGDILAVTSTDVVIIWIGAILVIALLWWRWAPLLTSTLSPDLSVSRGIDVEREQLILMMSLAILVAVAIKLVGALLITAILIIPAAAARVFSHTPERMAVTAVVLGVISVAGGLWMSVIADTPTGPSIVVMAGLVFVVANVVFNRRLVK
jgi:zinc transport system permease protein